MKITAYAFALASLLLFSTMADDQSNSRLEKESEVEMPTVEASAIYKTMKIERGQVENDESVYGYEVELEWYGIFAGVEACHDMTNVNRRRWRYNEIESFLGYGYTFGDLAARAAYVYKSCAGDESDTQAVEGDLEYETPWVSPYVALEYDTMDQPGALYGVVGLGREFELCERLNLVLDGGVGFGNAKRNKACFDCDRPAFREIHLGAALEIAICPHLKLVPSVDFYDYFTSAQRRHYDKFNGFAAVVGCQLAVDF